MNKIVNISFVLLILFSSCKKKKTSWQTDWTVPIASGALSLDQYVNDSTLESNGTNLSLDFSRNILNIKLADFISLPDTTIVQSISPIASGITIPAGFTVVNEIEEHEIAIPNVELKKIRVKEGIVELTVFNPLQTITTYNVLLPGVTKNGNAFNYTFSVAAGTPSNPSSSNQILDISSYEIDLKGQTGMSNNILQSKLIVTTDPNGSDVAIDPSFVFSFEAKMSNISIDYAQGYFGNQLLSDTITYNLPVLDKVTQGFIDFPSSNISVEINNSMKLGIASTIHNISNTNSFGTTLNLLSNQIGQSNYVSPATGTWDNINSTQSIYSFTSSNSNIEAFLENLPYKNTMGYSIELNPWGNVNSGWDEIFSNSELNIDIKAQMPLDISVDQLTIKDTFPFSWDVSSNFISANTGKLILQYTNAFPISCQPKLYFLNSTGDVIDSSETSALIESSIFGSIDPSDGIQKNESIIEFIIDNELINKMSSVKNIVVKVVFNTPSNSGVSNSMVSIPVGAFISFNLLGNINLNNSY